MLNDFATYMRHNFNDVYSLHSNVKNFLDTKDITLFHLYMNRVSYVSRCYIASLFGVSSSTVYMWRNPNTISIGFALKVSKVILEVINIAKS